MASVISLDVHLVVEAMERRSGAALRKSAGGSCPSVSEKKFADHCRKL
jgi:hypothetical protein